MADLVARVFPAGSMREDDGMDEFHRQLPEAGRVRAFLRSLRYGLRRLWESLEAGDPDVDDEGLW